MNILIFYKNLPTIRDKALSIAKTIKAESQADPIQTIDTHLKPVSHNYDLLVVIGGDGTLLHAEAKYPNIPKLPIGAGRLHFLSSAPLVNWDETWKSYQSGDYGKENRQKIYCAQTEYEILNEFYLTKSRPGQLFEAEIYIDKEYVAKVRGDGIIIATPTGSTGYGLSAGGSIIDPSLAVTTIVPVVPFTRHIQPLVVPSRLPIDIIPYTNMLLVGDGFQMDSFKPMTNLHFIPSEQSTQLIRMKPESNFYHKLQLLH